MRFAEQGLGFGAVQNMGIFSINDEISSVVRNYDSMLQALSRAMTSPAAKRLKTSGSGPLIGTHNGHFHADEALAVYLLRLLPAYFHSPLLRTRDPSKLETCHTVVDVGGEYDPARNRYDHHQRTFDATFSPQKTTKLSSAGLVYLHFGQDIIAHRTGFQASDEENGLIWRKLYDDLIEAIDANDNGISVYNPKDTQHLTKRFSDGGVNLGSIVGDLNYDSSDDESDDGGVIRTDRKDPNGVETAQAEEDARFLKASELMGKIFMRKLKGSHKSWLPSRKVVEEVYLARKKHHPSGQIMVFESGGCPWKDHLYTFEASNPQPEEPVIYVLYPEGLQKGSKWRVQAVPVSRDSFESRKALPATWRGLRDQELDQVSGIEGCVFVHAGGFIGGNKSLEGAMEMARKGLEV